MATCIYLASPTFQLSFAFLSGFLRFVDVGLQLAGGAAAFAFLSLFAWICFSWWGLTSGLLGHVCFALLLGAK